VRQLTDYIKVYPGVITPSLCAAVLDDLARAEWRAHSWQGYGAEPIEHHSEQELTVTDGHSPVITDHVAHCVATALQAYVNELADPGLRGGSGISRPRYNRYQINNVMEQHCDHIYDLFDGDRKGIPVLSVVGALNDNYKGGEFVMFEDTHIPLPSGSVMVFPSVFLYPHRVEPITEGIRYSLVSWAW